MSINQFTCAPVECSGCFLSTPQHSQSVLAPVPTSFGACCWASIQNVSLFLQKQSLSAWALNIKSLCRVFGWLSVEKDLQIIFFFFLFILHILPNLFGIEVSKCFRGAGTGSKFHNLKKNKIKIAAFIHFQQVGDRLLKLPCSPLVRQKLPRK